MATSFQPDSKGVITGTSDDDKITWAASWKKALTVNAEDGNDFIDFRKSGYKNNKLNGGNGNDTIYGGTNVDIIHGDNGNDKIYGKDGNDKLFGDAGNDTIYGGYGNDIIYGNAGNDALYGQAGNNKFGFKSNDKKDYVYSGKGSDTLVFSQVHFSKLYFKKSGNNLVITGYGTASDKVIVVDYYKSTSVKNIKTKDKTLSIERAITESAAIHKGEINGKHIIGTNGNDTLKGTDKNDIIHGKLGSDIIYGYAGNDIIDSFIDTNMDGGDGNDYLSVKYGFSTLSGGAGNDTIWAYECHNEVYGGAGNDSIECGYASYIDGGAGNDTIHIFGEAPEQSEVYGGKGNDSIIVDTDHSFVYGGSDSDNVYSGNDTITIKDGAEHNSIYAEDGNNTIDVRGNNNVVFASDGKNTISIYSGYNSLSLGSGDNTINLNSSTSYKIYNNNITTQGGNNTISLVGSYFKNNTIDLGAGNISLGLSNSSVISSSSGNVIKQKGAVVSDDLIANKNDYNCLVFLGNGDDTINIKGINNIVNAGNGSNTITIDSNYYSDNNIVYGGTGNDTYNVTFGYTKHSNTISDVSGSSDSVIFGNTYCYKSSMAFYINVHNDEDKTYDSDMIIYNTSRKDLLTIKDYMGNGKIETIKSYDDYRIDDTKIAGILQEVGTWLSETTYTDVQDVIDTAVTADVNAVIAKFNTAWVKP